MLNKVANTLESTCDVALSFIIQYTKNAYPGIKQNSVRAHTTFRVCKLCPSSRSRGEKHTDELIVTQCDLVVGKLVFCTQSYWKI